jgi:hypothetical protein
MQTSRSNVVIDRLLQGIFLAGLVTLAFLLGTLIVEFRWFPYPQYLEKAYQYVQAKQEQQATLSSLAQSKLWTPARFDEVGVVEHEASKAFAGYTFYTSSHMSGALLIDMQGTVVHEWELPFHSVWPVAAHIRDASPVPEEFIYWRRAHLYPNGDVLAVYIGSGDTPWGYGVVKVDKDSNLLWKYAGCAHHDLYVHDDETIWVLLHGFRESAEHPVSGNPQIGPTYLEDYVVQLSPEGKELRRVSVLKAVSDSPFQGMLHSVPHEAWDPLHTNTVKVLKEDFASHHEFAEAGQVLVSFRTLSAIGLIDLDKEQMVWAQRGFWIAQHDPDPLPDGRILIYDNRGHAGSGGCSRILEYEPVTHAASWTYTGVEQQPFESKIRGAQQRLPNGNVLITESVGGRIFEVSRAKEIVWDYHTPERLTEGEEEFTAVVCGARRFSGDELEFLSDRNNPSAENEGGQ